MRIHIIKTCGAFDYKDNIHVDEYKADPKTKANAIIIVYKGKELVLPLSNIAAIE